MVKVPKSYQPPIKGADKEGLAYLSEREMRLLAGLRGSKAHKTPHAGIPSFALDPDDQDDMNDAPGTGNWQGAPGTNTSGDTSGDQGGDGTPGGTADGSGTQTASSAESTDSGQSAPQAGLSSPNTSQTPTANSGSPNTSQAPQSISGIGSPSTQSGGAPSQPPDIVGTGNAPSATQNMAPSSATEAISRMGEIFGRNTTEAPAAPNRTVKGDNLSLNKDVDNLNTKVDIEGLAEKGLAKSHAVGRALVGTDEDPENPYDDNRFSAAKFQTQATDKIADFFGRTPEQVEQEARIVSGEAGLNSPEDRAAVANTFENNMTMSQNFNRNVSKFDAAGINRPGTPKKGPNEGYRAADIGTDRYDQALQGIVDAVDPDSKFSRTAPDSVLNATHYYNPKIADPSWGARSGRDFTQYGPHTFGTVDTTPDRVASARQAPRTDPAGIDGLGNAAPGKDDLGAGTQVATVDQPLGLPSQRGLLGVPENDVDVGRDDSERNPDIEGNDHPNVVTGDNSVFRSGYSSPIDHPNIRTSDDIAAPSDWATPDTSKPNVKTSSSVQGPSYSTPAPSPRTLKSEIVNGQFEFRWSDEPPVSPTQELPPAEEPEYTAPQTYTPNLTALKQLEEDVKSGKISRAEATSRLNAIAGDKWAAGLSRSSIPEGWETTEVTAGPITGYVGVDPSVVHAQTVKPYDKPMVGGGIDGMKDQSRLGDDPSSEQGEYSVEGNTTNIAKNDLGQNFSENPMQSGDISEEDQEKVDNIHAGKEPPTSAAGVIGGAVVGIGGVFAGIPGAGIGARWTKNQIDRFHALPSYAQRDMMRRSADARANAMSETGNGVQRYQEQLYYQWSQGMNIPSPHDPLYNEYRAWMRTQGHDDSGDIWGGWSSG